MASIANARGALPTRTESITWPVLNETFITLLSTSSIDRPWRPLMYELVPRQPTHTSKLKSTVVREGFQQVSPLASTSG